MKCIKCREYQGDTTFMLDCLLVQQYRPRTLWFMCSGEGGGSGLVEIWSSIWLIFKYSFPCDHFILQYFRSGTIQISTCRLNSHVSWITRWCHRSLPQNAPIHRLMTSDSCPHLRAEEHGHITRKITENYKPLYSDLLQEIAVVHASSTSIMTSA